MTEVWLRELIEEVLDEWFNLILKFKGLIHPNEGPNRKQKKTLLAFQRS